MIRFLWAFPQIEQQQLPGYLNLLPLDHSKLEPCKTLCMILFYGGGKSYILIPLEAILLAKECLHDLRGTRKCKVNADLRT
eukprot:1347788-Amphidinium_carterae.1